MSSQITENVAPPSDGYLLVCPSMPSRFLADAEHSACTKRAATIQPVRQPSEGITRR